jgi:hypothetical protein
MQPYSELYGGNELKPSLTGLVVVPSGWYRSHCGTTNPRITRHARRRSVHSLFGASTRESGPGPSSGGCVLHRSAPFSLELPPFLAPISIRKPRPCSSPALDSPTATGASPTFMVGHPPTQPLPHARQPPSGSRSARLSAAASSPPGHAAAPRPRRWETGLLPRVPPTSCPAPPPPRALTSRAC